jgi:hypothetical protein
MDGVEKQKSTDGRSRKAKIDGRTDGVDERAQNRI